MMPLNKDKADDLEVTLTSDYSIWVNLMNDDGEERTVTIFGVDPEEAIIAAEDWLIEDTGDDSWVMNDWGAK